MAKVKSDGLPPHWDEDRVRKHFKGYGDIERTDYAGAQYVIREGERFFLVLVLLTSSHMRLPLLA